MKELIAVKTPEANSLRAILESKSDPESLRLKRFLSMPDLSRTHGNPIYELAQRIVNLPDFNDFDVVEAPEIVPADI